MSPTPRVPLPAIARDWTRIGGTGSAVLLPAARPYGAPAAAK